MLSWDDTKSWRLPAGKNSDPQNESEGWREGNKTLVRGWREGVYSGAYIQYKLFATLPIDNVLSSAQHPVWYNQDSNLLEIFFPHHFTFHLKIILFLLFFSFFRSSFINDIFPWYLHVRVLYSRFFISLSRLQRERYFFIKWF